MQVISNASELIRTIRYRNVRLDTVHYCELEYELSAKRKRRSFFERNGDPKDATQQRLKLFSKTVRGNGHLSTLVFNLKMPYMTRESSKADLARTVSVLPNLRYVDLPDGFFSDDASTNILKQELQQRCPDIRKMAYHTGSEESFTILSHMRQWQNLEILELSGLRVEPGTLLYVLASFPILREVKLRKIPSLDDSIFTINDSLPLFPPLMILDLEDAPMVTSAGIQTYLSRRSPRETLSELRLSQTGVLPSTLHEILHVAPCLSTLWVNETVSRSFPLTPIPPLASNSLHTIHYEILPSVISSNPPSETCYHYLASSLLSGSLPCLTKLYVFSTSVIDLLLYQPNAPFANGASANGQSRFSTSIVASSTHVQPKLPFSSPSGLVSPLNLYTKSASTPEIEWSFTHIEPPSAKNGRRGSVTATRPLSLVHNHGLSSPSFAGHNGRNSTIVGNGFGGFLAVPNEDNFGGGRPGSSNGHVRKGSKSAQWMG